MTSDTKRGKTVVMGVVMLAEHGSFTNIPQTLSEQNILVDV